MTISANVEVFFDLPNVDVLDGVKEVLTFKSFKKNKKRLLSYALRGRNDLRKAYEKCIDISQESRALIETFLKKGFDKDYELDLSMYGKATKLEKQMDAKLAWLPEKYYYRSQESVGCSSSQADLYLTEKELHQHLDEEALRETLEEKAIDEKAREEKIRQKLADDDEFFLEFRVVRYDSKYESSD
uniref:Uncharacterized protein n=1 Tax=Tanacetum cinerariifolium TaxID=118510 RepID=A0A699HIX8_TANCI|nr:hypothetical protein [Tanacetum cinerariifolium]